ncbi:MAG: DUF1641 domain-containing protein [Sulfolobaceae archaeon]
MADPIEKLLEPQTFEKIGKFIDATPTFEKIVDKLRELDSRGQLDSMLNLIDQAITLIDAIQKSELINALVSYALDQFSKLQTFWPIFEKLTSERTANLLQKIDIDSLISTAEKLTPVINKLTDEKVIKVLSSIDYDSLFSSLEKLTPTLNKFTQMLDRLQTSGKLDTLLNITEQTIDLIDAVVKTELVNTLVSYAIDLLPTLQSIWPLFQKISDEKLIKSLQSMNLEELLTSFNNAIPLIKKFTEPEVIKTLSELDVNSLLNTLKLLSELQKNGTLDRLLTILKIFSNPEVANTLTLTLDKFSRALVQWYKELPNARPASVWSLLRPDRDTAYGLGVLISLVREIGKSMR